MGKAKLGLSRQKLKMHYSVGAVIKKENKFLLINRVKPPLGFAGIAGHIDQAEVPLEALSREVEEESGLKIINDPKLLYEEELNWNWCSKGINIHYWFLYECEVKGGLKRNYLETKSIAWYSQEDLKKLKLEPVWDYWFKKLKII